MFEWIAYSVGDSLEGVYGSEEWREVINGRSSWKNQGGGDG